MKRTLRSWMLWAGVILWAMTLSGCGLQDLYMASQGGAGSRQTAPMMPFDSGMMVAGSNSGLPMNFGLPGGMDTNGGQFTLPPDFQNMPLPLPLPLPGN